MPDSQHLEADHLVDVTDQVCPMTYVRTRLALDRMRAGETLLVKLRGAEAAHNVPRSATEQGHRVVSVTHQPDGITWVILERKAD